MSATLTRKPDLKEKLEILAEGMRRDQSKLVDEAIGLCREYATLMRTLPEAGNLEFPACCTARHVRNNPGSSIC
ncbi:hypothetical protein [Accumulibacter sp.]|jgi:hypothetical protein|uniref:Uncharacterized protein n=1 Tax=Accumulibacter regalis TaxID=522306 RepID=C7RPV2_ACCRE|nr:hypothetical protein [Accumulibacter sp.]MBN8496572.1 hypothetical protein [Accumulibacter sp.]MBO3714328.1 hypothetical protein [Accumulibacter sp.]